MPMLGQRKTQLPTDPDSVSRRKAPYRAVDTINPDDRAGESIATSKPDAVRRPVGCGSVCVRSREADPGVRTVDGAVGFGGAAADAADRVMGRCIRNPAAMAAALSLHGSGDHRRPLRVLL